MRKLNPQYLRVGLTLPFDLYDGNGKLLLRHGFTIAAQQQIDKLLEQDLYCVEPGAKAEGAARSQGGNPFNQYDRLTKQLEDLLVRIDAHPDFVAGIGEVRSGVRELWHLAPDASLAAVQLMPHLNYATLHAMHCAMLLCAVAEPLGIDSADQDHLLAAALTMNVGMQRMQNQLFHQAQPLSEEQHALIEQHPAQSVAALRQAGVTDETWLALVLQHHESWDGKGYPQHLDRDAIHPHAHLLHLVDLLAAKLTRRSYREPLLPNVALAQLFRDDLVDKRAVTAFIKVLGVYPPGTLVKLESGDIAIVLKRTDRGDAPRVGVMMTSGRLPVWPPVQRDTVSKGARVAEAVSPTKLNLKLPSAARIWGYEKG